MTCSTVQYSTKFHYSVAGRGQASARSLTRAAWPETGPGGKTEEWPCSFTFICLDVDDFMNTRP